MKITHDVREDAREQNVAEEKALAVGMAEKSKEFLETGAEIYHGHLPEGGDAHHWERPANFDGSFKLTRAAGAGLEKD